jgi:hypothetical protein
MTEQIYKKVGKKYIPVGYSDGWSGFPSDGIWIVQTKPGSKSSECIMKIGELENLHPYIDLFYGYEGKIIKFLAENTMTNESRYDFARRLIKEISK